jgi:hypothetical protein
VHIPEYEIDSSYRKNFSAAGEVLPTRDGADNTIVWVWPDNRWRDAGGLRGPCQDRMCALVSILVAQ